MSPRIVRRQALHASQLPNNYPALIKRVLANRHITQAAQLDYQLSNLPSPFYLKACSRQ